MGRDPSVTEDDEEAPEAAQEPPASRVKEHVTSSTLMSCIRTEKCGWETSVRVLKILYPEDEGRVIGFIRRAYCMKKSTEDTIRARWCLEGMHEQTDLRRYVDISLEKQRLITETIPLVFGGDRVRSFSWDKEMEWLDITIDRVPTLETALNLVNGTFSTLDGKPNTRKHCIKMNAKLFENGTADVSLAKVLIEDGIERELLFDKPEMYFRAYQPASGVWKQIDDHAAGVLAANRARALIVPMHNLQSFREGIHPLFNRKRQVVNPTSLQVKQIIATYTDKNRNMHEVLKNLKEPLQSVFDSADELKQYLCFSNGLVDLKTGLFLGPAKPELRISRCVQREYKPDADTTEIESLMQSFFPEACYPGINSLPKSYALLVACFSSCHDVLREQATTRISSPSSSSGAATVSRERIQMLVSGSPVVVPTERVFSPITISSCGGSRLRAL